MPRQQTGKNVEPTPGPIANDEGKAFTLVELFDRLYARLGGRERNDSQTYASQKSEHISRLVVGVATTGTH